MPIRLAANGNNVNKDNASPQHNINVSEWHTWIALT